MPAKLTKAFAEFVGGRCIGGIQRRLKRLLSADFTAEMDWDILQYVAKERDKQNAAARFFVDQTDGKV